MSNTRLLLSYSLLTLIAVTVAMGNYWWALLFFALNCLNVHYADE